MEQLNQEISTEDPYSIIADLNNRVRILESKYNLSRERTFVINQNMIDEYKKSTEEIRLINSDLKDIKKDLFRFKEILKNLVKDSENFARKENLKVLEKYINFWNPLNFVTEKEVVDLIKKHNKNGKKENNE